jgi:ABC-2 type transport system permease protein
LALVVLTLASYPAVRDNPGLDRMAESLPEAMRAMFGQDFTSPAGYLDSQLFSLMIPLLLLIYAIGHGAKSMAGEENEKTLDLLLANPVTRRGVAGEKFTALAVALAWLCLVLGGSLVAVAPSVNLQVSWGRVAEAVGGAGLLSLMFGALALCLGCATGKRGVSLGLTAALATAAYFLNSLAPLVDALEPSRRLSPFYYYAPANNPVATGIELADAAVLVAAGVVLFLAGAVALERRDLKG